MPTRRESMNLALLDDLRLRHGNRQLCNIFHDFHTRDREHAAGMLRDGRLRFPALWLLRPEICKHTLEGSLDGRSRRAMELSEALTPRGRAGGYSAAPGDAEVLRWMLHTGCNEEGLGEPFDQVMDGAAALLAREHGDRACLPVVADMMFARHRRGLYSHGLEWALFESGDPVVLDLVARRLLSPSGADVELARRLLCFLPCFDGRADDPARQYRCVARWLDKNRARLRYTGEGSQQGPGPRRFEVAET